MSPYEPAGPIIHRRPLFAGAALAAVGTLVALVGMAISVLTTAASARRWVRQLDQRPGPHAARAKWHQARAAGAAGADAWRNTHAS
jgi:membrane protein implicated in regulation of membrane protease activity